MFFISPPTFYYSFFIIQTEKKIVSHLANWNELTIVKPLVFHVSVTVTEPREDRHRSLGWMSLGEGAL